MSIASNNDIASVISASSPGSTAATSAVQINPYGRGIKLQINCSSYTSGSFTVTLSGVINGTAYTILTSAALSAAAVTILTVYPGLTAVANVTATDVLPSQWKITITPTSLVGVVNVGACVIV
jgi:hypothetical protein